MASFGNLTSSVISSDKRPITKIRTIDMAKDLKVMEEMVNDFTFQLFGKVDVEEKVAKCYLSFCLLTDTNQPVAFMCLTDHPTMPAVPPWDWEQWVYNLYGLAMIKARNSFWIHLMLWDEAYKEDFLLMSLKHVFLPKQHVKYLMLLVPPGVKGLSFVEQYSTRIFPKNVETHKCQTIYLFVRETILRQYKIRRAVEEDNDDIVELIDLDSKRVREMYGDFYIAEILTKHPDSGRQIIVAEYGGVAVGVICLNENVNYELLEEDFEMLPFYGLRKPRSSLILDEEDEDITDQKEQSEEGQTDEIEGEQDEEDIMKYIQDLKGSGTGDVLYDEDDEKRKEDEAQKEEEKSSEESLDYTIVNVSSLHLDIPAMGEEEEEEQNIYENKYSAIVLEFDEYDQHLFDEEDEYEETDVKPISRVKKYTSKKVSFHGEPNAFCIEVATAYPEHMMGCMPQLMAGAFECFPERDFCVFCTPPNCYPENIVRAFVRLIPKSVVSFPHEIYVLHRDMIYTETSVRRARTTDYDDIQRMSHLMSKPGPLLSAFTEAVWDEDSDLTAYVLVLNKKKVIGMSILRPLANIDEVQENYDLRDYYNFKVNKPGTFGLIEYLILSPIFQRLARYFIRELHRLTDNSLLTYYLTPCDMKEKDRTRVINNIISQMTPTRIRKKPEVNSDMTFPDVLQRIPLKRTEPPSAMHFMSTTRLCSRVRYNVNRNILIVGFSETAVSFLESLICGWNDEYLVTFTNITVISPHDLSTESSPFSSVRKTMFPVHSTFMERQAHMIYIRCFLNQIFGIMTAIDRKNKVVIVDGNTFITYDILFLMCGEQFQRPNFNPRNTVVNAGVNFPLNVFIINTDTDAGCALDTVKALLESKECIPVEDKIIVYGYVLEAYCCTAALLEAGIPGSNLIFVEPPRVLYKDTNEVDKVPPPFYDTEVLEAVQRTMKQNGIKFYQYYQYKDWDYDPETKFISAAWFESKKEIVHENCIAMFMYCYKGVSTRTFLAINKAGLVFDGGLVISNDFRTNDPNIYAAGTMTKYSRKYYADHLCHRYFNLGEVGRRLGTMIRNKLVATVGGNVISKQRWGLTCEDGDMTVGLYEKPLLTYCKLPGNLWYLHVTKPGKPKPPDVAIALDEYGYDITTGSCDDLSDKGYFKIHLNTHETIETITCLAPFEIEKNNLISLWGKHERLLNKMVLRYEMGLIKDLFEYFKEPWVFAIYQDDFKQLTQNITDIMYTHVDHTWEQPLADTVIEMYHDNDWRKLSEEAKDDLDEEFQESDYPQLIEQQVVRFIQEHANVLPMYWNSIKDTHIVMSGCANSPLFKPQ